MAYASATSILLILPMLPQTSTAAGFSACVAIIDRHITRADATINSRICKRYAVPISPTPPYLAVLSEDLTTFFTYRSFFQQDNYNRLADLEAIKNESLKSIDLIANGKCNLIDTAGSQITEVTTGESFVDSNTMDYQPFFDVDSEYSWKFDDDLVDEIGDNR